MIVSIPWLKRFVHISESADQFSDTLTMLGHEAESNKEIVDFGGIITARIIEVAPHPNADKLKLCKVDTGDEILQIVCGAPNVAEGQIVPLAKIGTVLPGDFKIRKSKIRGEVSMGMLCSEKELNISDDHSGIHIFPGDSREGIPINDLLGTGSDSIELDITPNRPDALSHYGIARDYAAKKGLDLAPLENVKGSAPEKPVQNVKVTLEDPVGCPRYIAGIVKGVKIGPSPEWLVKLLESAGQRSINNIVDISNYVLLEMGHPTHIFDYNQFNSGEVLVRRAKKGELFTTLDEIEHTLDEQHLLITDGENPVALAGVMGGLNSAVAESTDTVLIESAYFDPVTIRKSSKSLGMLTEASRRFERGTDPDGALPAFWRIVHMLEDMAGGTLVSDVVDAYPKPIDKKSINLRKSEILRVSGFEIDNQFIETTLKALGIDLTFVDGSSWMCTIPGFRPDLEREIDLIEEIIRVYGYDNVPEQTHYSGVLEFGESDSRKKLQDIFLSLTGLGFCQAYNNSLQSDKVAGLSGQKPVRMVNPLNRQMGTLRTSLFPSLIENLKYNMNNGTSDLKLFESGQIHWKKGKGIENLIEKASIAGILSGFEIPSYIHDEKGRKVSLYSAKGCMETFIQSLTGKPATFKDAGHPFLDQCLSIHAGKTRVGYTGKIKSSVLQALGVENIDIPAFEVETDSLLVLMNIARTYEKISLYPGIERDINLVLDESTKAREVIRIINKHGGPWLETVVPANYFKHESLGKGKKSIVFRMTFRHDSRTLEDKDVNAVIEEIIAVAGSEFGAKLRV